MNKVACFEIFLSHELMTLAIFIDGIFFDGKLVVVIHETMAKLITWKSNPNENKDRSAKKKFNYETNQQFQAKSDQTFNDINYNIGAYTTIK